jgi:acyl carrier protein
LIIEAAPDPAQAAAVKDCSDEQLLDAIIPFSSVILLGVVVAVEDNYGIRITREAITEACTGGTTLRKLAGMVETIRSKQPANPHHEDRHYSPGTLSS